MVDLPSDGPLSIVEIDFLKSEQNRGKIMLEPDFIQLKSKKGNFVHLNDFCSNRGASRNKHI